MIWVSFLASGKSSVAFNSNRMNSIDHTHMLGNYLKRSFLDRK